MFLVNKSENSQILLAQRKPLNSDIIFWIYFKKYSNFEHFRTSQIDSQFALNNEWLDERIDNRSHADRAIFSKEK